MSIVKRISALGVALVLIPSLSFAAGAPNLTPMTGDEIKSKLTDKTINTIPATTLNGKIVDNKFTGQFGSEGKLTGKFDKKPDNGPQMDNGTWRVNEDNMLCFKWNKWDSNAERCVALYKVSNGIVVVNSDNGFETVIVE